MPVSEIPENDIANLFNNEAMLAISYAIEDLALEVGEGELTATFQDIKNFEYQKTRYQTLAKRLDSVRVWADGTPAKRLSKIDFLPINKNVLKRYWLVVFASEHVNAALVCRQVNRSKKFPKKVFTGFYTFNPFVVQTIRRNLNLLTCGLDSVLSQWEQELDLPNLSVQDIDSYLQEIACDD